MKAIYARQSVDKKDSLSIEGQIESCKWKLKENEPFKTYEDHGFSGKSIERPQMKKLITDIEQGLISEVIVYRLDRFSRNIIDFYKVYEIMQQHKCGFVSVSENFDTTSAMGRATMSILITFAEMERENISQRVKDNYYYKLKFHKWAGGPAPYGYRITNKKGVLEENEEELQTVKEIFDLYTYSVNISLGKICNILKAEGKKRRRSKNGTWQTCTVAKLLQNPIYVRADSKLYKYFKLKKIQFTDDEEMWTGTRTANIVGKRRGNANIRAYTNLKDQTIYLTDLKPIISSDQYIMVMERMGQNKQVTSSNEPSRLEELSGKLKCECGYAIKAGYMRKEKGIQLHCYARYDLHACNRNFNDVIFADVKERVGIEIQKQLNEMQNIQKTQYLKKKEKEDHIYELQLKIQRLLEIAERSDTLAEATLSRIEELQKELTTAELEYEMNADIIDKLEIPSLRPNRKTLEITYKDLRMEEKKYIVNQLVDKIILHENGDIEIFWKI